jgi:hypothetical protein
MVVPNCHAVYLFKKLARLLLAGQTLVEAAQRLRKSRHYLLSITPFPDALLKASPAKSST